MLLIIIVKCRWFDSFSFFINLFNFVMIIIILLHITYPLTQHAALLVLHATLQTFAATLMALFLLFRTFDGKVNLLSESNCSSLVGSMWRCHSAGSGSHSPGELPSKCPVSMDSASGEREHH